MNAEPLVSVLIPYYNDRAFLAQAIESVLRQDMPDFELVLVNHASTDGSRDVARGFGDPRIVHVDMPENHGAGGGLVVEAFRTVARGKYVKFFCADDIMRPTCLSRMVGWLERRPELGVAFGDLAYVDGDGRSLDRHWFAERPKFSTALSETDCLRLLAVGWSFLPWIGSLVRRDVLKEVDLDMSFVMLFDVSVWLQILLNGVRLGFVDGIVADYRIHAGQTSSPSRRAEAVCLSNFERQAFFRLFQRCRSVALIKAVFPDDPAVARLESPDDIPLAVALRYVRASPQEVWAYLYVHDWLQDASRRRQARARFGLTVAEFRAIERSHVPPPRKRSRWVRFRDRWLRGRRDDGGLSDGLSL